MRTELLGLQFLTRHQVSFFSPSLIPLLFGYCVLAASASDPQHKFSILKSWTTNPKSTDRDAETSLLKLLSVHFNTRFTCSIIVASFLILLPIRTKDFDPFSGSASMFLKIVLGGVAQAAWSKAHLARCIACVDF